MIADSITSLSAVYAAVDGRPDSWTPIAGDKNAFVTREAIRTKMQEASGTLSAVVTGLQIAVRERDMLDHRFAASVEQEEAARDASLHDHLTGMPNRALFRDRLLHGIEQALRHGWTLALMFIDLNNFKAINDRYGHDVGDCVLQAIANRLRENTRGDDSVSRHGGDEFLYLAMDVQNEANIALIAEKLAQMIQAPLDVTVSGVAITMTIGASIGISIFPKHGTDANTLVNNADRAMYAAKYDGLPYAFSH